MPFPTNGTITYVLSPEQDGDCLTCHAIGVDNDHSVNHEGGEFPRRPLYTLVMATRIGQQIIGVQQCKECVGRTGIAALTALSTF
jgi:hypothetical protein